MRLVIDARSLDVQSRRGVGRYLESILRELESKLSIDIILVSNRPIYYETVSKHVEIRYYSSFKYLPGTLFINFVVPFLKFGKDVIFWGPSFTVPIFRLRTISTIHDLVAYEYPETMTRIGMLLTRLSTFVSLRASDRISVVSEFTRRRLLEIKGSWITENKRIDIITNGYSKSIFYDIGNIPPPDIPFIMYLGTIEPRKNIPMLLSIYENMKRKGYKGKLKLIGPLGWRTTNTLEKIHTSYYRNDIELVRYLKDTEVNRLMNQADLFIFPSWYEGFGLPPLEALAAGCKVLCTKHSELGRYENVSKRLHIFDPYLINLDELATTAMTMIQEHQHLEAPELILSTYSWDKSADQLISVLNSFETVST